MSTEQRNSQAFEFCRPDSAEVPADQIALSQHMFAAIALTDMKTMTHAASDSGATPSIPHLQLALDGLDPIHGDDPNGGSGPIHGPDPNGEQHPSPFQPVKPS